MNPFLLHRNFFETFRTKTQSQFYTPAYKLLPLLCQNIVIFCPPEKFRAAAQFRREVRADS
jgi:hypothetical protein